MQTTIALYASLTALGLAGFIYFCNLIVRPQSWLRDELITMVALALLTGAFALGAAATAQTLARELSGGLGTLALASAGAELAGLGSLVATLLILGTLIRASLRPAAVPINVTPLVPRPTAPKSRHRLAA